MMFLSRPSRVTERWLEAREMEKTSRKELREYSYMLLMAERELNTKNSMAPLFAAGK